MMITVKPANTCLEIRQVSESSLESILRVYQHCEDFLALGPVPTASMEMVLKDLEISHAEHGIFCGIHTEDGNMLALWILSQAIFGEIHMLLFCRCS